MTRTQTYHATASTSAQPQKPPVESTTDEFGGHQTISLRTELLSPSTDHRDEGNHRSHHTGSKRKHKKHRSSRSHDQSTTSDASQRELLRIVLEQEAEADNLKKALRSTLERLDEETRKVAEYEKGNREAAEKLREISESRAAAEQEATRATQQLHVYEFQLQNAQQEIRTTQDTLKVLERQKEEAEELAARARARARKLHQKQIVFQAKEEGRRMGFEAGVRQAEEELAISTTARRALVRTTLPTHSDSRRNESTHESRHRAEERTPPPQSPVEEFQEEDSPASDGPLDDGGPPPAEQTSFTDGDSSTLRTPIFPPLPLYPPNSNQQPSHPPPPSQQPDPNRSPNVQVYSVNIPPPDQIHSHPARRRSDWVTAQEHRDMNGSETATPPHPVLQPPAMQKPQQPPARPHSQAPPPAPIFPVNVPVMQPQMMYSQTPPKSATSSKKKMLRFPSLKDKAQSWYRSFSIRRKNKPVIDPIEEELSMQQPQHNGHTNGGANPEPQMYNFQPPPPQSWYHEPRRSEDARSQNGRADKAKGHSRAASMDDRFGGDRVSIASTRLSQLGLVSPPNAQQGPAKPGSISGRSAHTSNAKQSAHKLSTINEDSRRGFAPPLAEVFSTGSRTASVPFAVAPQSEAGRNKKRPPDISVPPPDGFSANDPFVQGNFHVIPAGGLAAKSSGITSSTGSGTIGINVQPATAALFDNLPTSAPPNSGNHLTPNYVYRPPTMPVPSTRQNAAGMGWEPVMPSNASRKSRQSTQPKMHRQTQSFDPQHQGYADNQSMRSGHSRAASAAGQDRDPRRTSTSRDHSQYTTHAPRVPDNTYLTASPRAASIRTSGSKNGVGNGNAQVLQDGHGIRRVSSRGSMLSTHDPNTYIDPAFFAPDGSADPNYLHVNHAASPNILNRGLARTPSLEYIDP